MMQAEGQYKRKSETARLGWGTGLDLRQHSCCSPCCRLGCALDDYSSELFMQCLRPTGTPVISWGIAGASKGQGWALAAALH